MDKEPRKAGRTTISSRYIPGTVVDRTKMNGAAGESFLDKVFYITEGIMLTQVREITGIDGTTLQNWLKRGWVASPKGKYYTKEHLARILLIAMMRDTMQLSRVDFVLRYINGDIDSHEDDIIDESMLYDYICRILDRLLDDDATYDISSLRSCISEVTADYEEAVSGARKRLDQALEIIIAAYYAALIKRYSDHMVEELIAKHS